MSDDLARRYLNDLIAFDTTSRNSNLDLINWMAERLDGTGARLRMVKSSDGTKANLVASFGPDMDGGLMLAGHTDTVPVDGQNWDTKPYTLTEINGLLYGRGTCDMKGFCALALARAVELKDAKFQKPLHLAFTYDEEVGCVGAQTMVAELGHTMPKPDLVVVGEPTSLRAAYAHKGFRALDLSVQGLGAHSSNPGRGVSAIEHATALIQELYTLARSPAHTDDRFVPPFVTLNVGTIQGGSARNVVADQCTATMEMRPIPGDSGDRIVDSFKCACARHKDAIAHMSPHCDAVLTELRNIAPFESDLSDPRNARLLEVLGNEKPSVLSYFTEAGFYQRTGWNSIVCGPGSIDQAHQPNEFVSVEQVKAAARLLEKLTQAYTL